MRNRNYRNNDNKRHDQSSFSIPPAHILQGYEDVSPGATDKILEIVKKEQNHRHKSENENLYLYHRTTRLGQLLAFVLAAISLIFAKTLNETGNSDLAKVVVISLFGFYSIIAVVSMMTRNTRKRPSKPYQSKNHNNKKR